MNYFVPRQASAGKAKAPLNSLIFNEKVGKLPDAQRFAYINIER
jgi:hypothetical protein